MLEAESVIIKSHKYFKIGIIYIVKYNRLNDRIKKLFHIRMNLKLQILNLLSTTIVTFNENFRL